MVVLKDRLTKAILDKATKIDLYHVYEGKKGKPTVFEYSPYDRKWYFDRPGSMLGMVPCSKKSILEAFENDFSGRGYSSKYLEAFVYDGGKLIAVISDYEKPEGFKMSPVTKKSPVKKRTTRK